MSQINISNLTFRYDTYGEDIFKNTSVVLDTDWKLGLIGRNGRGKTTLLKLLQGELVGSGVISSSVKFEYFPLEIKNRELNTIEVVKEAIAPYSEWEKLMELYISNENKINEYGEVLELYLFNDGYNIEEMIKKELNLIGMDLSLLDRPFSTLSGGEQTKMLLVALFLRKNHFLLIDEPTNHLDIEGRRIVSEYLASKKGFILVSHDRSFVDNVVDHILSINKSNIEVQRGNFSSWQLNKDRQDNFEIAENEKLMRDIDRLKRTAKEKAMWSNKLEATKIGTGVYDRGFVGHKAAKMMKRAKSIENRQNKAIVQKEKLLKNIENKEVLNLNGVETHKDNVVSVKDLVVSYDGKEIFEPITFEINKGECICISGANGSGKTSIIKLLMGENIEYSGFLNVIKSVSYISQDTSYLKGDLKEYALSENISEEELKNNLRKLGFERSSFEKLIEHFSEGQKKKLLIAKSLCEEAEIYIWDEPLNFTDIITRGQIEDLILERKPTMLIVEHDEAFVQNIMANVVEIKKKI